MEKINRYIIDRRENPKGKNLSNRQRFIRRAKRQIRKNIQKNILERSISDKGSEEVSVSTDSIVEPQFSHNYSTGNYDFILPGNDKYIKGDTISKPLPQEGEGNDSGGDSGDGIDDFVFTISREEYLDIVFDGLELPNLENKNKEIIKIIENVRAGFTTEGNPAALNIRRSSINSLGRRIVFKRKEKQKQLQFLEDSLSETENADEIAIIEDEIKKLHQQIKSIPYIDPIDIRYNNFTTIAKPTNSAVMFCVMDVSASMGEEEKELAKRFYLLLYLFLETKYDEVDVIFIRHHHVAKECNEEEFFNSVESGGTVVSTGFELTKDIINTRYKPEDWNIYVAQASDGDNFPHDMEVLEKILTQEILPIVKYFMYIEISNLNLFINTQNTNSRLSTTNMWELYESLGKEWDNMACKEIVNEEHIIPVFRDLFDKEKNV